MEVLYIFRQSVVDECASFFCKIISASLFRSCMSAKRRDVTLSVRLLSRIKLNPPLIETIVHKSGSIIMQAMGLV